MLLAVQRRFATQGLGGGLGSPRSPRDLREARGSPQLRCSIAGRIPLDRGLGTRPAPRACMTGGQCRVVSGSLPPDALVSKDGYAYHQCDYERNSTGTDIAQFHFRMAIPVYPEMQFPMAPTLIIASKAGWAC